MAIIYSYPRRIPLASDIMLAAEISAPGEDPPVVKSFTVGQLIELIEGGGGIYAPLDSPQFTGTPYLPIGTTGVTRAIYNNSTSLATTAFVQNVIAAIAPGQQDLQQVTTKGNVTTTSIEANSFVKTGGTGTNVLLDNGYIVALSSIGGNTNLTPSQTSTNFTINSDTGTDATIPLGNGTLAGASLNNYTTAEQTKLAGIAPGAQVNVNADWNATGGDAQILNKPTIPSITNLVPYTGATADVDLGLNDITANSFVKSVNLPNQILASDGSVITAGTNITITGGTISSVGGTGGGGSSVNYYLNGGTNQGTFPSTTYYEFSKTAVIGTGADFSRGTDGLIASFITDVADPSLLLIPAGNWNLEFYFHSSSAGGSPSFYVELYKYVGTTFTLIASNSTTPEGITNGTSIDAYFTPLAVPETVLTVTDRLAIRVFVNTSGKTITLHTQNGHLCQVITTFTSGLTALNGLQTQVQNFAIGTTGSDFAIVSSGSTHTFNLPSASATDRGVVTTGTQTIAGAKTFSDETTFGSIKVPTFGTSELVATDNGGLLRSLNTDDGYPNISEIAYVTGVTSAIQTQLNYDAGATQRGAITTGTQTIAGAKTFKGTTATDTAPLGSELAGVTGTGTGWTLASGATNLNVGGYIHTSGPVTALTTSLAATSATYYQIVYTITGRTAGSITIAYGGTSTSGITVSGNTGPLTTSTAVLTITPTTDFNGTVVLSIKTIGTSTASSTFANSSSASNIEIRANNSTTNTFIGLNSGRRNTTGTNNTMLGSSTGLNNTTATDNTFVGTTTGNSNTIGSSNTFIGTQAGFTNTVGSLNTFIGSAAGYNNSAGVNNVCLGKDSGRYTNDKTSSATVLNNSILLGYRTSVVQNGQTNQIVIGYDAGGLGSNTTVLGSSSITGNLVYGTNFINQVSPAFPSSGTLTITNLLAGIINVTNSTATTLTLPTGTLTDTGVIAGNLPVNNGFNWSIINTGSALGAITMAAGTTHTIVGGLSIPISTSASFRTVKTAANTYITYRLT